MTRRWERMCGQRHCRGEWVARPGEQYQESQREGQPKSSRKTDTEHTLGPCECAKSAHSCANRSRLPWLGCWAYEVPGRLVGPYPLANSGRSAMFILSPFTSSSAEAITSLSQPGELLSTSISENLQSPSFYRHWERIPDKPRQLAGHC